MTLVTCTLLISIGVKTLQNIPRIISPLALGLEQEFEESHDAVTAFPQRHQRNSRCCIECPEEQEDNPTFVKTFAEYIVGAIPVPWCQFDGLLVPIFSNTRTWVDVHWNGP